MSEAQDFYLRQVALSAKAADESDLANQRDKHLRSQAAWQVLADRAGKTAAAKAANEAQKQSELLGTLESARIGPDFSI
ncbi:hypothetical protein [Novosphingobium sp. SG720]|uniref:hypothetical protein n=1 Tax=Novosphingobium TaxID=165696 RepID=UPI00144808D9|nr:hypothetical protein [Novosphingobium sp. SG720]NKJ40841.1 hypothetical protein [Novosphingobium sp. SG720]